MLSFWTISKQPGIDFGYQGLRGLPLPYEWVWYPTFPGSQNNLIYAVDFFFWVIVFNLAINFAILRKSNKTSSNNRRLFNKEFFYTLTFSVILFGVSLVAYMAF